MIQKAVDPPGRRPAGGVLPARPAMPWRVGAPDHSWKPLPWHRDPTRTQKTRPCQRCYPGGDVPGNPIDAHLLQMISPELKLAASTSQGLASRCKATKELSRPGKALHRNVADPRHESPQTYYSVCWIDPIEEEADSQGWESLADRPSTGSVVVRDARGGRSVELGVCRHEGIAVWFFFR